MFDVERVCERYIRRLYEGRTNDKSKRIYAVIVKESCVNFALGFPCGSQEISENIALECAIYAKGTA